eukprot:CAMPEP_0182483556 /NCGR_PEP_ID=MMETSP1319-20130603/41547_1 /TAXON_ID=172717 /ORGANISM="Bolidomonas pacifica, Strain RCC208" /LENGTH=208 /DNA_ID=CAMNT_0024685371 /DNA_START=127 /DNA_END=750 /DNA_ORIENTATION=-
MKVCALELRPNQQHDVISRRGGGQSVNNNNFITSLTVYRNIESQLFTIAYTITSNSHQSLQIRTYKNPYTNITNTTNNTNNNNNNNKSTNPFDDDDDNNSDEEDDSDNNNATRDRAFSKSSQGSNNEFVDSLEPLPPNARMSLWANTPLPLAASVTTVCALPGLPLSHPDPSATTPRPFLPSTIALHSSATKTTTLLTGPTSRTGPSS